MMAALALVLLALAASAVLVVGGVLFALFAFGAFLLALTGVVARHGDATVRSRSPSMEPRAWRNGSR